MNDLGGLAQLVALVGSLTLLAPPLGRYLARVYGGHRPWLLRPLGVLERVSYRALGVDPDLAQDWRSYATSLLCFSAVGFLALYAVLRSQSIQPLNPQHFRTSMPWDVAFNSATSFVSNTSWQYYGGETTLSNFSQMLGITVASFTSMAVGMSVAAAVIRGLGRRSVNTLGNFWADTIRGLLYLILPVSICAAIALVACGVPETLAGHATAHGISGLTQVISLGPVASQEAIKLLSGDGGGFFNTNSAHPFENPNGISNLLEMLLMLLVPAAMVFTFGHMTGRRRQGWLLYWVMLAMFIGGSVVICLAEAHGSPAQHLAGLHVGASGNLEGKEVRFGSSGSALYVEAGTASGDGAVNSAVESFTGAGLAVAMANMMTGEVIFGGPGSGLYGMLAIVLLTVFVAGLMVGRTPEYLGKQIQAREVKLASLAVLCAPVIALIATALAISLPAGRASTGIHGPEGFAQAAYAYLSQTQNNGSAMAGYSGFIQPGPGSAAAHGIAFADLLGGLCMTFGRFIPILLMLALAGSLADRRVASDSLGTLRTDTATFATFLIGFIVIVAVLTFLTVLVIAPGADVFSSRLLS